METTTPPLMPILTVKSVDAMRDFYVDKLGFSHIMAVVGQDGQLDFCAVHKGEARLMFSRSETPEAPAPSAQIYMSVPDVKAYHQELAGAGLNPTPVEDMWWGDRVTTVKDPGGYLLWFFQNVGAPQPLAGMKVV